MRAIDTRARARRDTGRRRMVLVVTLAAAAGKVVFVAELQVRGNTIIIDHGAGVMTAYNHLSEFGVAEGQVVAPGQIIGKMGSTGLVTGPHLHWEVIVRGIEVDGELWLTGRAIGP